MRARVFLIHGKQDRSAPIEHAERMRERSPPPARRRSGLVEPHEGHGFYGEGARERMYAAVLDFLRANTAAQREVR